MNNFEIHKLDLKSMILFYYIRFLYIDLIKYNLAYESINVSELFILFSKRCITQLFSGYNYIF